MARALDQGFIHDLDSLYEKKVTEQGRQGVHNRNAEGEYRATDTRSDHVVVGRPQSTSRG